MRTLAPVSFRASKRAWVGEFILPLVFFALLTLTAVNRAGLDPAAAGFGFGLMVIAAMLSTLLPMLRTELVFERTTLQGRINGRAFSLFYSDILAAWQMQRRRRGYLCLGTRRGTLFFPLAFFDDSAIWNEVTLRLPAETLKPEAIEHLPDYQDWARERQAQNPTGPRAVADHWSLQLFGWGGISLSIYSLQSAWSVDRPLPALVYLLPAGLSLWVLLRWGVTYITVDTIRRVSLISVETICWDDVRWLETDPLGIAFVLGGDNRQVVIPGPAFWWPSGRIGALRLFNAQVRVRGIPVRRTFLALLKVSRR